MSITDYPPESAASVAVDRQVFVAGGTWTKPTGCTVTRVQLLAGGAGGGGGGAGPTGSTRNPGSAGAAGTYVEAWYQTADLPATVGITVGTGGTGGTGRGITGLANTLGGNPGATGGETLFGTLLRAPSQKIAASATNVGALPVTNNPGGRANLGDPGLSQQNTAAGDGQHNQSGANARAIRWGGLINQPGGGAQGGGLSAANNVLAFGGDGTNNQAMDDMANVALGGTGTGFAAAADATLPPTTIKTLTDFSYGLIPWYTGAGGGAGPAGITGPATGPGGNGCDASGYGAGGGGGGAATTATGGVGGKGAPGLAIITSF